MADALEIRKNEIERMENELMHLHSAMSRKNQHLKEVLTIS